MAGRPQDTVIVFLAGHSGVRGDRLGLLLSRETAADRPEVLPYGEVLRNLTHLDALKRLVIIDACDAGAILDDDGRPQGPSEGRSRPAPGPDILPPGRATG